MHPSRDETDKALVPLLSLEVGGLSAAAPSDTEISIGLQVEELAVVLVNLISRKSVTIVNPLGSVLPFLVPIYSSLDSGDSVTIANPLALAVSRDLDLLAASDGSKDLVASNGGLGDMQFSQGLLIAIEAGLASSTKSALTINRELKRLTCSINYDGREGRACRGRSEGKAFFFFQMKPKILS